MSHSWRPIVDLPEPWTDLANPQVKTVIDVWHQRSEELKSKEAFKAFLVKLRRQWAIETGVLERLYTLSEGATRVLIEHGLDSALLSHNDTDKAPDYVMNLIRDQHAVIEGLYQFISGERALSKSYIRELHQALTTHQSTYDAVDSLGRSVTMEMVRGQWKNYPNNVQLQDGSVFEFCPPEHVESEMDAMIAMHCVHVSEGVTPEVEAAWLHHRFTLIHPFVDGNGRVARALATLILLRANWLPLVVTREDKAAYLESLRSADAGELSSLIGFIGELQRRGVRQALSLSEDVEREATAIKGILSAVTQRFAKRRQDLLKQYQRAVVTADAMFELTRHRVEEVCVEIEKTIKKEKPSYNVRTDIGRRGEHKAAWNRWQIVQCARQLGYYADLQAHPAWVELRIETEDWVGVLIAFHGIGHEWSGLIGVAPMAYRKGLGETGVREVVEIKPLATEPFEIGFTGDPIEIEQRFRKWLEDALIAGLQYWQQSV